MRLRTPSGTLTTHTNPHSLTLLNSWAWRYPFSHNSERGLVETSEHVIIFLAIQRRTQAPANGTSFRNTSNDVHFLNQRWRTATGQGPPNWGAHVKQKECDTQAPVCARGPGGETVGIMARNYS